MTTISGAFGVSNVFSLPIDHSSKDSTSESSRRSRRESENAMIEEAVSGHSFEETYNDPLIQDEGVLESYTKIWESFETKDFFNQKENTVQEIPKVSTPPFSPWWQLSEAEDLTTQAPRAKANSFGYQLSPQNTSTNGVGARDYEIFKKYTFSSKSSSKNSTPSKLFQTYLKTLNPEEDQGEKWEEDTNDTEIMKNINSLLDSGILQVFLQTSLDLYDYKETVQPQIIYNPEIYLQQHAQ